MRLIGGDSKQASVWYPVNDGRVWWVADRVEGHDQCMVGWTLCKKHLVSPHFPAIYEIGKHSGYDYIEMEHVLGEQPTAWSQPDAEAILSQLKSANIWHRDIRLCNILQRHTGEWCLLDFGWACDYDDPYPAPWYLGAEGRKGRGVQDDAYAMGVIRRTLT